MNRPALHQLSFLKIIQSHIKQHLLLIICGLMCACAYIYLAINSQYYGQISLTKMWTSCGLCALLSLIVWLHYFRQERAEKFTLSIPLVLLFAVLFRLIGITSFPVLEDDFYRYLWDGRMTIEFGSAYGVSPAKFFGNSLGFADVPLENAFEDILGLINHPEIATIYGPSNQYVFALSYLIAPGEVWPLQLIFSLADLGIIAILVRLAKPSFVLLYAWSPLIIKEFAFTAHPDVLGAFFMVAAFYAYTRQRWYWLAILLALAAGVKVFALVVVPLLLKFNWRAWCVFFATAICISLPFGIKTAWFPEGLKAMTNDWLFNAPLYSLLSPFFSIHLIKLALLSSFALIAASYFFYVLNRTNNDKHHHDKTSHDKTQFPIRIDCLYGVFFLCIPVLNPWYCVWLLPFAAIYPSRWAWAASISLFISYASGINLPETQLGLYQQASWVLIIQFGLIFVALLLDLVCAYKTKRTIMN